MSLAALMALSRVEAGMVAERGIEAILSVLLGLEILVAAGNVGVPPRERGRAFERTNRVLVLLDECSGGARTVTVGGRFGCCGHGWG